jgi:hypothetical protein
MNAMTETRLFFGTNVADERKPNVTDLAFEAFVKSTVTPRFPGFTLQKAWGSWEGKFENSFILTLIHPGGPMNLVDIEAIRQKYCEQFAQESVMRVDYNVQAGF